MIINCFAAGRASVAGFHERALETTGAAGRAHG